VYVEKNKNFRLMNYRYEYQQLSKKSAGIIEKTSELNAAKAQHAELE